LSSLKHALQIDGNCLLLGWLLAAFWQWQDTEQNSTSAFCAGKGRKRKRAGSAAQGATSEGAPSSSPEKDLAAFGRVVDFCMAERCRRAALLAHFGERLRRSNCGGCDWCCDTAAVSLQVPGGGFLLLLSCHKQCSCMHLWVCRVAQGALRMIMMPVS
jgi:hypothetical protein